MPKIKHQSHQKVLDYWEDKKVESMYDKNLLKAEIRLIKKYIKPGSKILDAGCGEAEGTYAYSAIKNTLIHGADFSQTRLNKAKKRLHKRNNVTLKKIDFLKKYNLDKIIRDRETTSAILSPVGSISARMWMTNRSPLNPTARPAGYLPRRARFGFVSSSECNPVLPGPDTRGTALCSGQKRP